MNINNGVNNKLKRGLQIMLFMNPYFTNQEKIELLQRWILVHSHIYYFCDYNVVSDLMFDNNSKQLKAMQEKYKKSWKMSRYYYAMKDFDGSTGAGFVDKLNKEHHDKITLNAEWLIDRHRKERE